MILCNVSEMSRQIGRNCEMEELLKYIKERNDADHAEIKDDLKHIRNRIAPQVAANKKAIAIILFLIAGLGFMKAFAF